MDGPTWNGRVHPIADLAPMLPDDELAELAEDIRENGLNHAIELDSEGTLIDGRNRLRACQMAGLEPRFVSLNGTDPIGHIISENVRRRHMTLGQRAMWEVAANAEKIAKDDFGKVKHGQRKQLAASTGIDATRLGRALLVYEFVPEQVKAIIAGSERLNDKYDIALKRQQEKETETERAARSQRELTRLRIEAPDLAARVDDNNLSTAEATALLAQRQQEERDTNIRLTRILWANLTGLWASLIPPPETIVAQWIGRERGLQGADAFDILLTAEGLRHLAGRVGALADAVEGKGGLDG